MSKPSSFPFLAIARRYGYDYGETLLVADSLRRGELRLIDETMWRKWSQRKVALRAIYKVNQEFAAIQASKIDWQTGEAPEVPADQTHHAGDAMAYALVSEPLVPTAWIFELANYRHQETGVYSYKGTKPQLSFTEPHVPEGSIRGLQALYPAAPDRNGNVWPAGAFVLSGADFTTITEWHAKQGPVSISVDYVCPICDGGPGNHNACTCQRGDA